MRRLLLVLALATCAVSALAAVPAFADATPVQLVLTYTPSVSNTDTPAASGIAELVLLEGEVRLNATGLPHLDGSSEYVAWLLNSQSNQFMRVGAFNANNDEVVHYENVLDDAIPDKHWNLLLVTVENGATPERPGNQHSIAGVFPSGAHDAPPQLLPNTGGDSVVSDQLSVVTRADWLRLSGLAALALLATGAAGYAVGRKHRLTSEH